MIAWVSIPFLDSCSQGNVLQAPPLDEEQPGDIGDMLPSDFMGVHMGACTPKSNQAGTLAAHLTPRPAGCTNPTEPAHSAVHPTPECAPSHSTDSYTTLVGLFFGMLRMLRYVGSFQSGVYTILQANDECVLRPCMQVSATRQP